MSLGVALVPEKSEGRFTFMDIQITTVAELSLPRDKLHHLRAEVSTGSQGTLESLMGTHCSMQHAWLSGIHSMLEVPQSQNRPDSGRQQLHPSL